MGSVQGKPCSKKYSVNCWETKCVYLIMTRGDKYKRDLERHKRLRGLYG